jgi:hypothetical protein
MLPQPLGMFGASDEEGFRQKEQKPCLHTLGFRQEAWYTAAI